jgi:hypothetical protein
MILRALSGLAGLAMLSYGTDGLFIAIRNPSLRVYLAQGDVDTVGIFGHDVELETPTASRDPSRTTLIRELIKTRVHIARGIEREQMERKSDDLLNQLRLLEPCA